MFRRRLLLAGGTAGLVSTSPALAQRLNPAFSVSPTRLDLSDRARGDVLRVTSEADQPLRVQVRLRAWRQAEAGPEFEITDELIASPPQALIEPGRSQVIRVVADRLQPQEVEQAFRLFVTQLPEGRPGGRLAISTMLEVSLPVFFAPRSGARAAVLDASVRLMGRRAVLELRNRGDINARLSEVRLSRGGATVAQVPGLLGYVLPRSQASFVIDLSTALRLGDSLVLEAATWSGPRLTIDGVRVTA